MALKKTMTFPCKVKKVGEFGTFNEDGVIEMRDAYIKVESVEGNKSSVAASVSLKSEIGIANTLYTFTPSVEDGANNFIKQAYEHLKTLDEFAGAVDC